MRKKMMLLGLIVLTVVILIGCSEDDGGGSTTSSNDLQFALVWVNEYEGTDNKQEYYYDLDINGVVMGNPIPEINYFKVNSATYNSEDNFSERQGYSEFGLTSLQEDFLEIGSSISFELNTDIGAIFGTETKPTQIHNLQINNQYPNYTSWPNIYVSLGDDVVLDWTYENERPDFLYIYADYYWYDSTTGEWDEIYFSEYLPNTTASYTLFEGYQVIHDGDMYFDICSVNGPNPNNSEVGNLTGSGTGYMYWENSNEENDISIEVGNGYKSKVKSDDREVIRAERKEAFRKELIEKLR